MRVEGVWLMSGSQRILVVRLGAIGDALRTLPAVRRVRKAMPDTEIGWAVENWVAPILRGNPNIATLHVLDRGELDAGGSRAWRETMRLLREIKAHGYDTVLDFHARFKSGVISMFSGARTRIGYCAGDSTEGNFLFNNVRVRLEDPLENRVMRFLHLLAPMGLDASFDATDSGISVPGGPMAGAREWHDRCGAPWVALYPGCSEKRMSYHRWPDGKWIELIRKLGAAGARSVIFWGPAEKDVAAGIATAAGATSCELAPKTGLMEMMAMISRFRVYLGYNTAAMHMAWLQGVPTALFTGPVQVRTDSPLPPVPFRVLRADENYRPGESKRRQADVTSEVPVDTAFKAVMDLLG